MIQIILCSSRAVEEAGKNPADLRNMVNSPGGTTTEAILQLGKGGLRSLLLEAVDAAYKNAERF